MCDLIQPIDPRHDELDGPRTDGLTPGRGRQDLSAELGGALDAVPAAILEVEEREPGACLARDNHRFM